MVKNLRRELWTPPPKPLPDGELARRKPGPIYDLHAVQRLLNGDCVFLATDDCEADAEKLEWDVDDIAKLIAALRISDYRASEWCKGRGGVVIDADAYSIRYDHIDACRGDPRHPKYYVKFGFRSNDPRLLVWVLSCHLS